MSSIEALIAQGRSRGVQRQVIADLKTGREIWKITAGPLEDKHTYYDVSPWSFDGRYITFGTADSNDLDEPWSVDMVSTTKGRLGLIDTASWEVHEFADNVFYESHAGSWGMWHPKRLELFYRQNADHFAAINFETGATRQLPGSIRQIGSDGKHAALLVDQPYGAGPGREVHVQNIDTGESWPVLTSEQAHELLPNRDEFPAAALTFGNTKWSPDATELLIAMFTFGVKGIRRNLFVVSRDGSKVRRVCYYGHHHSWAPSGKSLVFVDHTTADQEKQSRDTQRIFIADATTGERRMVIDQPMGSHPVMNPNGRCIADCDNDGAFVAFVDEPRVERLSTFTARWDTSHKGTHPHIVWNRDGTQALYNSAERGPSDLYLLPNLEALVAG